jgi:two-component system LytT family sensor kinase
VHLSMKSQCERCGTELRPTGQAYICSFECTFCVACVSQLRHLCPNCGGELIRRPSRMVSPVGPRNPEFEPPRIIRQWMVWSVSFAVWTLIAFASAFSMYQFDRSLGRAVAFHDELVVPLMNDLIFAFLTPFLFVKVLSFPIWENNRGRRLLAYIAAAFSFATAHVVLRGLLYTVWSLRVKGFASPLRDPNTQAFAIQWTMFKRLFLYNTVDDIVSVYLPIVLMGHLISYYQRMRERELRASQLETELAKAHLEALKTQLQPHFLFNTLHSISALMLTDVGAADRMMTRLSDLLRLSLEDRGIQITSLRHELEFVAGYLEIEKIRFQDRLRIVLEIAPDALDAQVPSLLLQPLVENAVRHGISRSNEPGEIRISATRNGDTLDLRVTDDCEGTGPVDLNHIKVGLGLQSSRGRLEKLYGDAQSLDIRGGANGGFEVWIRIPWSIAEGPWNQETVVEGEGR